MEVSDQLHDPTTGKRVKWSPFFPDPKLLFLGNTTSGHVTGSQWGETRTYQTDKMCVTWTEPRHLCPASEPVG